MQSASPKSICHLSLLNPAVHSRIYFKEALTQVEAGYAVTIIGQGDNSVEYDREGVKIRPFRGFRWLSLRRLWMPWKLLWMAFQERADIYQVHTPELLPMVLILRLLLRGRCKLVYDVHEDYYLNIRHGGYWPGAVRGVLAWVTRAVEGFCARRMDGVVYAERCFGIEGVRKEVFVLNKAVLKAESLDFAALKAESLDVALSRATSPGQLLRRATSPEHLLRRYVLFSGTIADNWGVLDAVEFWVRLNDFVEMDLMVAGFAQDVGVLERIMDRVRDAGLLDRFRLIGGGEYVPHGEIEELIRGCALGVGLYHLQRNIQDRIPTKFYEFMAFRKPLIFTSNPVWNALNDKLDFGVAVEPEVWKLDTEMQAIADRIQANDIPSFYRKPIREEDYSWSGEGEKLLNFLTDLYDNP